MPSLTIGATIWLLISLAGILNSVSAPRRLIQAPLALIGVEFVLVVAAFSERDCAGGPCSPADALSGPSEVFVSYLMPALAAALTLYLIAYGVRHHRRTAT